MTPLEILVYVYNYHKDFVRSEAKYSHQELFEHIGYLFETEPPEPYESISKGYASKVLKGTVAPDHIVKRLASRDRLDVIEKRFKTPGLFHCKSGQEIDALILAARGEKAEDSATPTGSTKIKVPSGVDDFVLKELDPAEPLTNSTLAEGEKGAQKLLVSFLLPSATGSGVVHWGAPPWSGASYIAHSLTHLSGIKSHFNHVCFIRPTDYEDPYSAQLHRLADTFGVTADKQNFPRRVMELLEARKILLVLFDACLIPHEESFADQSEIRRVLDSANAGKAPTKLNHILTIGRSDAATALVGDNHTNRLNHLMKVPPKKRFDLYHELYNYYREMRRNMRPEEGGARIKRGRWHYESIRDAGDREVWSGMVRMRAFFASNSNNHSYFDPTRSFESLTGYEGELPRSIAMFTADVVSYLRRIERGTYISELRALRLCSTAKHWLTQDALENLRQPYQDKEGRGERIAELTSEAFKNVVANQTSPIGRTTHTRPTARPGQSHDDVFTSSLSIRAIVQSEWFKSNPYERALAHWRVAERMWRNQDDKELLAREFPYLPHWGRSRIFILGECIRHLIAATRGVKDTPRRADLDVLEPGFFPAKPDPDLGGCNPHEVINFCYARIFQREINANRSFAPGQTSLTGRALAKRHGAFAYAAELLQLMSENDHLGEANAFLAYGFHESYIQECGFACLDIGELQMAKGFFQSLGTRGQDDFVGTDTDQLNLSLVLAELNEMDEAKVHVEAVKSRNDFDEIDLDEIIMLEARDEEIDDDDHEQEGDHESDEKKKLTRLHKQIITRDVHLALLTGDFEDAVEKSDVILATESEVHRRDPELVRNRIKALGNIEAERPAALKECFGAVFSASGEGFQHEVMSYRVLLARLFRQNKQGEIAEQILDDVQRDILKYGCAERTYLEMLYEAGRTLCMMNEDVKRLRAYASYLRPCLRRAHSRHYGRYVNDAAKHVKEILSQIEARITASDQRAWTKSIRAAIIEETEHANKEKLGAEGFLEVDPLFGYYVSSSQRVIRRLHTLEGLREEQEKLADALAAATR